MLDPAAHVLKKQMAGEETALIWRPHAPTKKCDYARARSVLIHVVMTEMIKSYQAAKDTKLFCPAGIAEI